jgi:AraC family ethanolamine operon transcriptional activator
LPRLFLLGAFQAISGGDTIKSENCNLEIKPSSKNQIPKRNPHGGLSAEFGSCFFEFEIPPRVTIGRGNRRRQVLQRLKTRDIDEMAEGFPGWDLRFRQLGRGPFRGQLQFLDLGGIQVFRAAVNRMVHAEGWFPHSSFGFAPVLAANADAVWRGQRLKVGQVQLGVPGQQADHVTAAHDYQLVALTVDGARVREAASVLGGCDPEELLASSEAVTTSPAHCRALWADLVGLLNRVQARPDLLAQRGRLIEQECLRRFLATLARPNHDRTACQPPNRARLVRRAEDYMQAKLGEPVSVLDLCQELAISERTLHHAFQEVRGMSPMAYFQAVRLNGVRQELKTAADTATVYEIAQRWGFWHTGEFAAAYRRLFGELPSQTLKVKGSTLRL